MNRVTFPITPHSDDGSIRGLQLALEALLVRGVIVVHDEATRRALAEAIARERGSYGDATRKTVAVFQDESRLGDGSSGDVDEKTAAAINALLEKLGLLDAAADGVRIVAGQVTADKAPLPRGLTVLAFMDTRAGPIRVGQDDVDATGAYAIRYFPVPGDETALSVVVVTSAQERLAASKPRMPSGALERIDIALPATEEARSFTVKGKVGGSGRPAVASISLRLYDVNPGGAAGLVELTTGTTGDDGRYEFSYTPGRALAERGKDRPDLLLQAVEGERVVAASDIRYDAGPIETIDLVLQSDARTGGGEFEALSASLKRRLNLPLRDLREDGKQNDISYLANKSGWDARTVAMAALADRFSADQTETGESLAPNLYYALFRAGLPAEPATLYGSPPATIRAAWEAAEAADIIPRADKAERESQLAVFRAIAAPRALDAAAMAGASTLRELIADTLKNESEQRQFALLRDQHRGNAKAFWEDAERNFGPERAARLKLDGRLGSFTLLNAPLIAKLHATQDKPIADPSDLARRGYFNPDRWSELVADAVPASVEGDTEEKRRENTAALLAAQIRLAYPTLSIAEQVRAGDLPVKDTAAEAVHAFLDAHHERFAIGAQPVAQFLRREGIEAAADPKVTAAVERIHRVYQITPDDRSMSTMLSRGFDSAASVMRYGADEFASAMGEALGGAPAARLVHAKAAQVHAAVLSIATTYVTSAQAPVIGGRANSFLAATAVGQVAPALGGDVIAMPTLEQLLGPMDYCGCDHCRSVLSPAAYLVDLLEFLDRPSGAGANPLDVLLERRPDIAALALSCENTNVLIPHVDLVNEMLAHFVAHDLAMTGFDGHDVTPEDRQPDLLAAPRYADEAARQKLETALFPPPLPFSQRLEALRAHFRALDTHLWSVMTALRPGETLGAAAPGGYGWRDILRERVGLSPAEISLLTDGSVPLADLAGLAGDLAPDAVIATLSEAKGFARRAGISYEELGRLLGMQFVNPERGLLPRLERLHVPFTTLAALKANTLEEADFRALLPAGLNAADYGGDVVAWARNDAVYARYMSLILLTDEGASADPCSFNHTHLRRAEPDAARNRLRGVDFRRMLRFLRLWRRLGWSMGDVDAAIVALLPRTPALADEAAELAALDAGFALLLDRLGTLLLMMDRLKVQPGRDLDRLLACWSDIGTSGADSLYARMFLSPVTLAADPAFADDGYGGLPGRPDERLLAHSETLRAALNLTGDELALLAAHLGFTDGTPLTLGNISALSRHGWLARTLKLSLRELLEMIVFSGLDPFAAPDFRDPAEDDTDAAAMAPCLRFVDFIAAVRAAGLKPSDVLLLFAGVDVSGRSTLSAETIASLAHSLRAALGAVTAEFAVAADPTGDIARSRIALVVGQVTADAFVGLLDGTAVTEIDYDHNGQELEADIAAAGGERLIYDDLRKRLAYGGLLLPDRATALKAVPGVSATFTAAIEALASASEAQAAPIFAALPELRPLHDAFVTSVAPIEERRQALLDGILPSLISLRKERQAIETFATAISAPAELVAKLAQDVALLHANEAPARPAVADLTGIAAGGLGLRIYWRSNVQGAADQDVPLVSALDALPGTPGAILDNPAQPMEPISAVWSGWIDAPETGVYGFSIDTDAGASVTLQVAGETVPLDASGSVFSNRRPVTLAAGTPVPLQVTIEGFKGRARLRWSAQGMGWQIVPSRHFYPDSAMARLGATTRRLVGIASLAAGLKLRPAEIVWLGSFEAGRIDGEGWYNRLPAAPMPKAAAQPALAARVSTISQFVALRQKLAPDDGRLVALLTAPTASMPDGSPALEAMSGWSGASIDMLLARLGVSRADLVRPAVFTRLAEAIEPLIALRIPAGALMAAATVDPSAAQVAALQSALRARYSDAEWRDLLKPVNDGLRARERDALVAHVLQRFQLDPATRHIDTADRLFELFLIDVQMQPCMETSRIRAALSSVQLFIERSMMNLEPRVPPAAIRADQWEWMKRYRVWEANRKVFLWPENWLEPELRDDQSPAFREVMGSLLQSDITEDTAAQALGAYLMQLDEVAKLEPCGMHIAERDPGIADDLVHVVSRSHGAGRKYFHRTREGGSWQPWNPVKLDIEDAPVIPVVWRERLFLFWLTIRKDPLIDPNAMDTSSGVGDNIASMKMDTLRGDMKSFAARTTQVTVSAILNWSEKVGDAWQPARASNPERPTVLGTFAAAGVKAFDRSSLRLKATETGDFLHLSISGAGSGAFYLYNTHGSPIRSEDVPPMEGVLVFLLGEARKLTISHGALSARYTSHFTNADETRRLINVPSLTRLVESSFYVSNAWHAPFIIEDRRHAFYVRTASRGVTFSEQVWLEPETAGTRVIPGIPPLRHEFQEIPAFTLPDPVGPIATGVLATHYELDRYIGADTRIRTGMLSADTVTFDGVEFGLAGPVAGKKL
ncbi:virulence plasmid A protein [Ancylobacter aquaticus]|uniref:Virulence plasmid A protein n=1 Tax=Ancylobacter aquaticus TaxID=100 RepID=A0A4R1HC23_ANCAQ|nr:neuraminidase-like domain-containing protein [Ancylobacter aquaticus]TCK16759.1 virulence plasmid A protein [Ancylobacter aquaticus]